MSRILLLPAHELLRTVNLRNVAEAGGVHCAELYIVFARADKLLLNGADRREDTKCAKGE